MAACRGLLHRFHRRLAGVALSNLAGILAELIPPSPLDRLRRSGVRRRIFCPEATFWNFLAQVLSPAQPCRETLRQMQASRRRRAQAGISSGTGAYCQARRRLREDVLQATWREIAKQLATNRPVPLLWRQMRVGVVGGTTVSMPDTVANQVAWPQPRNQKPGRGFPVMKLVALFSLATGAAHALVTGTLHDAEHTLFPRLWDTLTAEFDLLLGDRGFGSFAALGALRCCGLHGVFRLNQCRKVDWHKGKRLGKYDRLFRWTRPRRLSWWLPHPVPESLEIRILKVCVPVAGFRTQVLLIATDLLDAERFPAHALAELYRRRWQVELFFRHIKTAMHMEVLRCKTPAMIHRELHMHMIAYNLIRSLMLQAALSYATPLCRISFKGSCTPCASGHPTWP